MHSYKFVDDLKDQNVSGRSVLWVEACFHMFCEQGIRLSYDFADFGRPVLVVPWVVVQELDALKNNKSMVRLLSHSFFGRGSATDTSMSAPVCLSVTSETQNERERERERERNLMRGPDLTSKLF